MRLILVFLVAAGLGAAFVTFCTVLVTPASETGTVGKTEIVARRGLLRFLDSPEALCRRSGMVASTGCGRAAVAALPAGATYLTLPYSDFLYRQTLNSF